MAKLDRIAQSGFVSMIALTASWGAAHAQAGAAEEAKVLNVVNVTAQRQEESIQEVPIAITALDADALAASKIEDTKDLQFAAPNVTYAANRNLTIRGVGSQAFGGSRDVGVGILIDGVFIQSAPTSGEYFDLERIEVLRGPQGTLFGRNTTAGAIHFISKRPEEDFGGYLDVQLESFSGLRANAALNIPLTDNLLQRFSMNYLSRDGYTENLLDGTNIDGRNQYSIRSATRFMPTPDTTADLILEFSTEDSDRIGAMKTLCTPDPALGCSSDSVSTDFPSANFLIDLSLLPGIVRQDIFGENPSDLREVVIDTLPQNDSEAYSATFEASHDFGNLTLTSISGWRRSTARTLRDFDQGFAPSAFNPGTFATPFGPLVVPDNGAGDGVLTYLLHDGLVTTTDYRGTQTSNGASNQISTELHLSSDFEGPLNFIIGAYYLDVDFRGNVTTYLPSNRTFGFIASGDTPEATTEATAIFGEVYYDLTDTVKLTGGVRHTIDDKTIETRSGTFAFGAPFIGETSFEETTWRAAISWSPDLSFTNDTNLYGSVSRGFKSGGFNPGTTGSPAFEPEFITAYEVGAKNILFDNRLQANLAAFFYDYENLVVGNIVGTLAQNVNIPKAETIGFEAELIAEPTDNLRLEAALGLLDAEVKSQFLKSDAARGGTFFELQGNKLANSPDYTLKLAAEYEKEFVPGWLTTARVDYYTQSEFFSRDFNTPSDEVDGWDQMDLQLNFQPVDRDLSVGLFVKNVFDEDSITALEVNSNLVGSFRQAFLLDPRIFGASLRVGF